jgi:hypothetical protein
VGGPSDSVHPERTADTPKSLQRTLALTLLCAGLLLTAARPGAAGVRARLYPGLAAETPGTQAEVDRILAQERARLDVAREAGGVTLEEILRELESAERAAGVSSQPAAPVKPVARPLPEPTLIQQLRAGYYSSELEAANLTIPTTVDAFIQYNTDYRSVKSDRLEYDLNNVLHVGSLKSENRLDATVQYTPEERFRARLREHLELQKNGSERLTNDYDLDSTELTLDYNFPVRLRALARGLVENKAFDRESSFNFSSRTQETELYLERPFMKGTYSVDVVNEGQSFGSDPLSDFQRQTVAVTARGSLSRLFDGEARFIREKQDRNMAGNVLDYGNNTWYLTLDYRMNQRWLLRVERDLEDKLFVVPDDINFDYRRTVWRPSLTYLPTDALTLILDTAFEEKRHFDRDPTALEQDEDFDILTLSLTATYMRNRLFLTATVSGAWHDHLLADNQLQADFVSTELSSAATYNFSSTKSASLTASRTRDNYQSIAESNNSVSTILTGDVTVRF